VLGHTVRLMPSAYVKPYVKRHKNDATDAEAICEAVARANMRFVTIQDTGAAKLSDTPSHTPSAHPAADADDQCHPGPSRGVWHRGSGGGRHRR